MNTEPSKPYPNQPISPTLLPITYHPAREGDTGFIFEVFRSNYEHMLPYLPLEEDQLEAFLYQQFQAQSADYRTRFPGASHWLIRANRQLVGRIYIDRREAEIRILDITIHPRFRNQGIGTYVLIELIQESIERQKPIRIMIEHHNRSIQLFERLGFSIVENDGMFFVLEKQPDDNGDQPG